MTMADDWDELEALSDAVLASTGEFSESTRGGAGSPIERRMADAFTDMAAALSAQSKALKAVFEQQRRIEDRLDDMERAEGAFEDMVDSVRREVKRGARSEIRDAMNEYGGAVKSLHERTDEAIAALGRLDGDAAKAYRAAVDESCKRLRASTAGSIAVIAAFSILGGILAAIGAFLTYQVFPPMQAFAAEHGTGVLIGIIIGIGVFIWLVWSVFTAKR